MMDYVRRDRRGHRCGRAKAYHLGGGDTSVSQRCMHAEESHSFAIVKPETQTLYNLSLILFPLSLVWRFSHPVTIFRSFCSIEANREERGQYLYPRQTTPPACPSGAWVIDID